MTKDELLELIRNDEDIQRAIKDAVDSEINRDAAVEASEKIYLFKNHTKEE